MFEELLKNQLMELAMDLPFEYLTTRKVREVLTGFASLAALSVATASAITLIGVNATVIGAVGLALAMIAFAAYQTRNDPMPFADKRS